MLVQRIFLLAGLALALTEGCGGSFNPGGPSIPTLQGPDTFSLTATLSNVAGTAVIYEVDLSIDNVEVANSCQADLVPQFDADGNFPGNDCQGPESSSATVSATGNIGPGSHHLELDLSTFAANGVPAPYTVPAFNIVISDANGKLLKTTNLPTQTVTLTLHANSISYAFSF